MLLMLHFGCGFCSLQLTQKSPVETRGWTTLRIGSANLTANWRDSRNLTPGSYHNPSPRNIKMAWQVRLASSMRTMRRPVLQGLFRPIVPSGTFVKLTLVLLFCLSVQARGSSHCYWALCVDGNSRAQSLPEAFSAEDSGLVTWEGVQPVSLESVPLSCADAFGYSLVDLLARSRL